MTTSESRTPRTKIATTALLIAVAIGAPYARVNASRSPMTSLVPSAAATPTTDETSPPDTSPADTSPARTTQESVPPASPDPTGDDTSDRAAVAVAVVGFIALLGIAVWWMLRRTDPDDQPYPRPGNSPDSPGDRVP